MNMKVMGITIIETIENSNEYKKHIEHQTRLQINEIEPGESITSDYFLILMKQWMNIFSIGESSNQIHTYEH